MSFGRRLVTLMKTSVVDLRHDLDRFLPRQLGCQRQSVHPASCSSWRGGGVNRVNGQKSSLEMKRNAEPNLGKLNV